MSSSSDFSPPPARKLMPPLDAAQRRSIDSQLRPAPFALPFLGSAQAGLFFRLPAPELWSSIDPVRALLSLRQAPSLPLSVDATLDGWSLAQATGRRGLIAAAAPLAQGPLWAKAALIGLSDGLVNDAARLVVESDRFYLTCGDGGPFVLHKTLPATVFLGRAEPYHAERLWPKDDLLALSDLCAALCVGALEAHGKNWADPQFGLDLFALGLQSAFERSLLSETCPPPAPSNPAKNIAPRL